jgi:hypothetical protein
MQQYLLAYHCCPCSSSVIMYIYQTFYKDDCCFASSDPMKICPLAARFIVLDSLFAYALGGQSFAASLLPFRVGAPAFHSRGSCLSESRHSKTCFNARFCYSVPALKGDSMNSLSQTRSVPCPISTITYENHSASVALYRQLHQNKLRHQVKLSCQSSSA